jgi:hypothetical protein
MYPLEIALTSYEDHGHAGPHHWLHRPPRRGLDGQGKPDHPVEPAFPGHLIAVLVLLGLFVPTTTYTRSSCPHWSCPEGETGEGTPGTPLPVSPFDTFSCYKATHSVAFQLAAELVDHFKALSATRGKP